MSSCSVCMDDDAIRPFVQIEPCGHALCVLCARECSAKQGACPFCRGKIRKIACLCDDQVAGAQDEMAQAVDGWWCYQSRRRGMWWTFDRARQTAIFDAQRDGRRRFVASLGILSVEIDLDKMTQTVMRNGSRSKRVRAIALVSDASQIIGVAGLPNSVSTRTTTS